MRIEVIVRSVYGAPKVYPHNEAAKTLAQLAGTETLTRRTLELAKQLGHTVYEVVKSQLEEALAND